MKIANIGDFFYFRSRLVSTTVQAHAVGLKNNDKGVNEHWNLIDGNYKGISFPVTFKQEHGKKLTDILDTGWPSLYLISERMKIILEENNLTGWKIFSIKLYDKRNNEIPDYHGFSIVGKCSPMVYDNCEIIEKRRISNGPICKFYKGVHIEEWDGSDFFIPEGTCHTIISKKGADVLKKNKISNLELKNLADYETSVTNVPKKAANG